MTAQLAPTPVFKAFDNNGLPLAFGLLTTYKAGTLLKQATYVDSTQTTQNTNPIELNFRGECALWLDPTLTYKFSLTDQFGNTIPGWPVDNVPGGFGAGQLSVNLIPNPTNTFTLGSPTNSWAQLYLGANSAPAYDPVGGNIGYYARTAAEIAASVTPVNYAYAPGNVLRYGTNTNPGTTDMTTAFSNALLSNSAVYVPVGTYLVSSQLTLQSNQTLYGDGSGSLINFSSTANTDFIVGSNVSNTTVRDLKLVATGVTTVMNYQGMVAFRGSTACKVLRCEIQGFYASGIVLNACQFCEVDGNYLHGAQGSLGSNSDIHVLTTAAASSISCIISNNICAGTSNDFGIALFNVLTSGLPILKCLVIGNRVEQHAAYGILVYDSATVPSNTWNEVSNNFVNNIQGSSGAGAYGAGIYVAANGGICVNNNVVRNCCVQTSAATLLPAGIAINATQGLAPFSIVGNSVFDMAQGNVSGLRICGIWVSSIPGSGLFTGGVISGNLISQQTNGGLVVGIFAPGPNSNITISGNEIQVLNTLSSTVGIFCYASSAALSNLTVSGNVIQGCSTTYIEIINNGAFNLTNVNVNGNTCSGGAAGCLGFLFQNWIQGAVTGNVVSVTTTNALNFSTCTQIRLANNTFITTGTQAVVTGGACTGSYYDKSNFANTGLVNAATGLICEQLASATPGSTFNSAVGDRIEQSVPVVGNPKGWRCTVAGGPGTWISEGNL